LESLLRELQSDPMAIPPNLKKGIVLRIDGQPYLVLEYWQARMAQRRTTLHAKLRDLKKGKVIEKTLDDKSEVDVIESQLRVLQYLYSDPQAVHFMDVRTFDQYDLPKELMGDADKFLIADAEYRVLFLDGQAVQVEIPPTVTLEVLDTPPSAGTASGNTYKIAKLQAGFEIQVPRFVKTGDRVRVNTETLEYLGKD
jgi:elongation factor P